MLPLHVLNAQPAEKPDRRADGSLDVHSVFLTIQGEGPLAGTPAVFVRLAGCDLACKFCDTEYTRGRRRMTPAEVEKEINRAAGRSWQGLVVLTGGEPFRQSCGPLLDRLCSGGGLSVQVETNGSLWDGTIRDVDDFHVSVVCSPKVPKVHPNLIPLISAWKYIIAAGEVDPDDGLPMRVLGENHRPARPRCTIREAVYVQPQDDKDPGRNAANARAAVESCLRFGYRLSVQTHKYLGLE